MNAIEVRALAELRPNPENPRLHGAEQLAAIGESLERFGWMVPVLVDEAGMILAGHGTVEAARGLGLDRGPVLVAAGWSEAQKRAYCYLDNRLAELSRWDPEALRSELTYLEHVEGVTPEDLWLEGDWLAEVTGPGAGELALDYGDLNVPPAAIDGAAAAPVGSPKSGRALREAKTRTVACPRCGATVDLL